MALSDLEAAGFGAVVAIEPQHRPGPGDGLQPPLQPEPDSLRPLLSSTPNTADSPLLDRATQGQYPPGSTFKVVTAAAGLNSGTITPETTIDAPGTIEVQGQPLQNDFNQNFGPISLDTALTNSVNTWFGQLGQRIGESTLFKYMDRFGFNATPAIDLPEDEVYPERRLRRRKAARPRRPGRPRPGRDRPGAPGGDAAADGRGGRGGRRPRQADEAADLEPGGRTPTGASSSACNPPNTAGRSAPKTAAELTTAMEGVVSEGTGTNAAIPGVAVAGKTGTAETPYNKSCGGGTAENQGWFIGFAPAKRPEDRDRRHGRVHDAVRQRRRRADLSRRRGNDPAWRMTR